MECASACADDVCVNGCYARLCPAGAAQFDTLSLCVETSCATECGATGDPDTCNSCVSTSCDAEMSNCLASSC
jgi:hypothetical protein